MTINHQIILNETKDYIFITLGLILYSFGFTFFLMPYEIVTGGVAGIAAIVYYATSFPNSYTYFLVNAALLVIGLKILGWKFL
ncbi:MAG: YitT family protein, partial [Prevotella sp.]|nr:YitT family protein [Prevotella sp.]